MQNDWGDNKHKYPSNFYGKNSNGKTKEKYDAKRDGEADKGGGRDRR